MGTIKNGYRNYNGRLTLADNVFGLGEVAEHKTSLELQMFKLK